MTDYTQEIEKNIRKQAKLGMLSDLLLEALESHNMQIAEFVLKFNEKETKKVEEV